MQNKKSPINWSGYGFFLVGVIVVEIVARLGWLTSYVPPPSSVFAALYQGMINGDISSQIGVTLSVYVRGLALATCLAITIGILMGTYKPVFDSLKIIVEFLRPVPSVAMIPLAILFFGLGATMRISVITYAAFWPMLINTIYGVRAIDPQALDVARNFGITGYEALLARHPAVGGCQHRDRLPHQRDDRADRHDHDRTDRGQQRYRLLHLTDGTGEPPAAHVRGDHSHRHPRVSAQHLVLYARAQSRLLDARRS